MNTCWAGEECASHLHARLPGRERVGGAIRACDRGLRAPSERLHRRVAARAAAGRPLPAHGHCRRPVAGTSRTTRATHSAARTQPQGAWGDTEQLVEPTRFPSYPPPPFHTFDSDAFQLIHSSAQFNHSSHAVHIFKRLIYLPPSAITSASPMHL